MKRSGVEVIMKITFLLDFLHYSVDNLHLRHKVSKVIAIKLCLVLVILLIAVPT